MFHFHLFITLLCKLWSRHKRSLNNCCDRIFGLFENYSIKDYDGNLKTRKNPM